jgi:hypothetical protein
MSADQLVDAVNVSIGYLAYDIISISDRVVFDGSRHWLYRGHGVVCTYRLI